MSVASHVTSHVTLSSDYDGNCLKDNFVDFVPFSCDYLTTATIEVTLTIRDMPDMSLSESTSRQYESPDSFSIDTSQNQTVAFTNCSSEVVVFLRI